MRNILAAMALVACAPPVYAAVGTANPETFYVAPAGACAFSGDGLAANCAASAGASGAWVAFSSISWTATTGLDDGDTLCFFGLHRDTLTIGGSGSTNLPITIKGNCAGLPLGIISGANVETTWTGPDGNGNWTSTNTFTEPTWVLVDGKPIRFGASATTLKADEYFYSASKVLVHSDPTNKKVEISVRTSHINSVGYSWIVVDGGLYEGSAYGPSTGGIVFRDCANIVVQNTWSHAVAKAIDFRGSCTNARATGNYATWAIDGLDTNLQTSLPSNITFDHNVISGSIIGGTDRWTTNYESNRSIPLDHEGIACTYIGNNYFVDDNEVSNFYQGITFLAQTNVSGYYIRRNYVHHIHDDGIQMNCLAGCKITASAMAGNIVHTGGFLGTGNTSYAILTTGGAVSTAPGSHIDIVNNTAWNYTNGIGVNCCDATRGYSDGAVIGNNIVQMSDRTISCTSGTPCGYMVQFTNWQNVAGAAINNNNYFQPTGWPGPHFRTLGFGVRTGLAAFKPDMTPNESASTSSDPLFYSPGADFRLRPQSPLRGASIAHPNCTDKRGYSCGLLPNVGAYQDVPYGTP